MFKKIFSFIFCAVMLFCLAACDTANTQDTAESTKPVFKTENITRITFYAFSGEGEGSEVPAEHMEQITAWLASFAVGEKAPDLLPPGTNTVYVEIAYSDGTTVKSGLDTATVDGVTYYTENEEAPDCFQEIMSHTSVS